MYDNEPFFGLPRLLLRIRWLPNINSTIPFWIQRRTEYCTEVGVHWNYYQYTSWSYCPRFAPSLASTLFHFTVHSSWWLYVPFLLYLLTMKISARVSLRIKHKQVFLWHFVFLRTLDVTRCGPSNRKEIANTSIDGKVGCPTVIQITPAVLGETGRCEWFQEKPEGLS